MSSETLEYGKLTFEIDQNTDQATIKIKGNIDEDFIAKDLLAKNITQYIFDMEKVKMINSCGIREWISFIEATGDDSKLTYVNCPQVVIQQMNIVDGFLSKNAQVITFFAPYYNEDEDEEILKLLNTADIKDNKAPEYENLEFDAIEKQYFNFINLQKN